MFINLMFMAQQSQESQDFLVYVDVASVFRTFMMFVTWTFILELKSKLELVHPLIVGGLSSISKLSAYLSLSLPSLKHIQL